MTNSANIKQINQFIFVDLIVCRFEDKCNTRIHPSKRQFRNKLLTKSDPVQRQSVTSSKKARATDCTCRRPVRLWAKSICRHGA